MKKRFLSCFLSLSLLLTMMPTIAFAKNDTESDSFSVAADKQYIYPGETMTVTLTGNAGDTVTISGYNDEDDWYVTDGLALHYDGIYNAEMGVHDADASTWTQLVEDVGGDLATAEQTWTAVGLKVEETGVAKAELEPSIVTRDAGMTVEQIFSIANVEDAMGTSGDYFYPIRVHISDSTAPFGNVRRDGPSLNYFQYEYEKDENNNTTTGNGANSVLSVGALTDESLTTMTMTSNGSQTRATYRNGDFKAEHTFAATGTYAEPDNDYYSFEGTEIPANKNIKAVDWTSENNSTVTLEKTVYGLRVYTRELTEDEIARNAALDQARFEERDYVTPGTVNDEPLLEYDYSVDERSTTVTVSGGTIDLTLNELTDSDGRTLTFANGDQEASLTVVVMSETDADQADTVIDKITALPDANDIDTKDESAISEAVAAYENLNEAQKGRVGQQLKDKLDACVIALDEHLAGTATYTLIYDLNDDDGIPASLPEGITSANVLYKDPNNTTFTLDVPTRPNYTFLGWWYGDTQITAGNGVSFGQWTILGGGNIKAHWERTKDLGTESNPYPISTSDQWYALARILETKPESDQDVTDSLKTDYANFGYTKDYAEAYETLQTSYYQLKNNITLTWTDGYFGVPNFKGTLDGNNKIVTLAYQDLNITVSAETQFGGLIKNTEHCVIKNLTLNGMVTGSYTAEKGLQDMGLVIGATVGTKDEDPVMRIENVISNVSVDITIDVKGTATSYLGSMIGRSFAPADGDKIVLENCVNNGNITVTYVNAYANTGRVGGLIGHAYAGTTMIGCKNYGAITHKGQSTFNIGGMVGSGNVAYENCVQGGNIQSPRSNVVPFPGLTAGENAGNVLEITVTGTPGTSVTYADGETKQLSDDGTATFLLPIYNEEGIVENNAFSYNNYFTVDRTRLDFFSLSSRAFSAHINVEDAADLKIPFQSEQDALIITTADQMLTLQKAINEGDEEAIAAVFASQGYSAESIGYSEARLALQSGYYKLNSDITLSSANGYTGIGTRAVPFGGHLDGNGHTITLEMSDSVASQYAGVFGYINPVGGSKPSVKSLKVISDIDLDYPTRNNTTYYIGSLAGALGSSASSISLSDVDVQVNNIEITTSYSDSNSDTYYVGGIVGYGAVSNADAVIYGNITAEGKGLFYVGGVTGAGSVKATNVTFREGAEKISANSSDKSGSCVAIASAYTFSDITFSDVQIENANTSAVRIQLEGSQTGYAGGLAGYLPTSTTNQVYWLKVDDSIQVNGVFEVSAQTGHAGGLAGKVGTGYSVFVDGFVNMMDVSAPYAGGLFGEVSPVGTLQTLCIQNSLNVGVITGTGNSIRKGALIGYLNIKTAPKFNGNAYVKQNGLETIGQIANTGITVENDQVAAEIDMGMLSGEHSYRDSVQLVTGQVPAYLSVAPADAFGLEADGSVTFTKVGTEEAELVWNNQTFYTSESITILPKDLTNSTDVIVTGVNNVYPSDDAAAQSDVEIVYDGILLVADKDYTVTQNVADHKFTIAFQGNYTGSVEKSYEVDPDIPLITSNSYIGIYDGLTHNITVIAAEGVVVTYSDDQKNYSNAAITLTNVGTKTVYWKVEQGNEIITGSGVVSIAPATLTITADDQSVYVGNKMPEFTYTITGLVKNDQLNILPTLACDTPNTNTAGSYTITVGGADAGDNYIITYVNGTLTIITPSESGGGASHPEAGDNSSSDRNDRDDDDTENIDEEDIPLTEGKVADFDDVPADAWFAEAVQYAYEHDLMTGVSENLFAPNAQMNRAMVAQILFNMEQPTETEAPAVFRDVAPDAWYAEAVNWAVWQGYMSGYGAGNFGPNDALTREQLVTVLWRYSGSPVAGDPAMLNVFSDAALTSDYAQQAMIWAYAQGVISGNADGTLNPQGTATRAEIAQMLMNYCENVK